MQFDFLYKEKTLQLGTMPNGDVVTVTLCEIPHGEYAKIQDNLMKVLDSRTIANAKKDSSAITAGMIESIKKNLFSSTDYNDQQTLAAIKEWNLPDDNGGIAPITLDVYRQLPHSITELIEKAVEELNPSLDKEFPSEPDSEGSE